MNKALIIIQAELKTPKNQTNSFGGYKFRSCEDILEAVKPLLLKTESVLTIEDDVVLVGDRIYVKATATIWTKEGEFSVSAFAREAESQKGMNDSQLTGSTSSYARKYALNGLFCIDDTKDADATNTHDKEEPVKKAPVEKTPVKKKEGGVERSMKFVQKFQDAEISVDWQEVIQEYGVKKLGELNDGQFLEIKKKYFKEKK